MVPIGTHHRSDIRDENSDIILWIGLVMVTSSMSFCCLHSHDPMIRTECEATIYTLIGLESFLFSAISFYWLALAFPTWRDTRENERAEKCSICWGIFRSSIWKWHASYVYVCVCVSMRVGLVPQWNSDKISLSTSTINKMAKRNWDNERSRARYGNMGWRIPERKWRWSVGNRGDDMNITVY